MPLENGGYQGKRAIGSAHGRHGRDHPVFPGNHRQRQRSKRAEDLRDENDMLATQPIRQMAGRQRKRDHRDCNHQTNQSQRRRGMRARVKFPLHRHRQHQTTGNGKEIAGCKQTEVAEAKRRIGIMGRLFQRNGRGNRGALLLGRRIRVWVKGHSRSERSGTARRRL